MDREDRLTIREWSSEISKMETAHRNMKALLSRDVCNFGNWKGYLTTAVEAIEQGISYKKRLLAENLNSLKG